MDAGGTLENAQLMAAHESPRTNLREAYANGSHYTVLH
jgi:hypothetical protein